jgi:transposase-like protein
MKRKRRNHSASFKAKVAVAAIRGDKTLAELSEQFDVHQNQIQDWRRKLLDQANQVFERAGNSPPESEHKVKELHAKIGELTMERDFLEQGLERIHGPRGKK